MQTKQIIICSLKCGKSYLSTVPYLYLKIKVCFIPVQGYSTIAPSSRVSRSKKNKKKGWRKKAILHRIRNTGISFCIKAIILL